MKIQALFYLYLILAWNCLWATELLFDRKERFGPLPRYRTCAALKMSASGQPTKQELFGIKEKIPSKYRLILVDLRNESHGYLNGEPILWTKDKQAPTLTELFNQPQIQIQDRSGHSYIIAPEVILTEEALAKTLQIDHVRFSTKHAQEPAELLVDAFIQFVDTLKEDDWLHLHCREGWSRTTLYCAMLDMLKNAMEVPFQAIIRRQYEIGGANMAAEPELSVQYNFLQRFYTYAKLRKNGFTGSWSDYCRGETSRTAHYYLQAIEGPLEDFEQQNFPDLFSQDFYYQGQGCSTVAFRSADDKFVLKLFKFRDAKTGDEIGKRLLGYQLAMKFNRENTGMIYYHLHQTKHLNTDLRLFEKIERAGQVVFEPIPSINPDDYIFVIQEKAKNLGSLISEDVRKRNGEKLRMHLRGVFALYHEDYKKGFLDIDPKFIYNTGYIDDRPIRYDLSHLRHTEELNRDGMNKFKRQVIEHFIVWTQRKNFEDHPEIFEELLLWLIDFPLQRNFESREDFFRKAKTYRLWYNLDRPNFSKGKRTPMEIVDVEYSNEVHQGKPTQISVIDLDRIALVEAEMRGQSLPDFPEQKINKKKKNEKCVKDLE